MLCARFPNSMTKKLFSPSQTGIYSPRKYILLKMYARKSTSLHSAPDPVSGWMFFFPLFTRVCCLWPRSNMSIWPSEWCIYISEVLRCWNVNDREQFLPPKVTILHVLLHSFDNGNKRNDVDEEKEATICTQSKSKSNCHPHDSSLSTFSSCYVNFFKMIKFHSRTRCYRRSSCIIHTCTFRFDWFVKNHLEHFTESYFN